MHFGYDVIADFLEPSKLRHTREGVNTFSTLGMLV